MAIDLSKTIRNQTPITGKGNKDSISEEILDNLVQTQDYEKEGPSEKLSRWTMGRISCVAKAALYSCAAALSLALAIIKIPCAFVATPFMYCFKGAVPYSISGIARDLIMTAFFVERAVNSVWGVIASPREHYASICQASAIGNDFLFHTRPHQNPDASLKEVYETYLTFDHLSPLSQM